MSLSDKAIPQSDSSLSGRRGGGGDGFVAGLPDGSDSISPSDLLYVPSLCAGFLRRVTSLMLEKGIHSRSELQVSFSRSRAGSSWPVETFTYGRKHFHKKSQDNAPSCLSSSHSPQ